MQHGRDTDRFAYLAQSWPGILHGFAQEHPAFSVGDSAAAGHHYQHVVLDELAHQIRVSLIVRSARVVAADDASRASDPTRNYGVVQRPKRTPERAALHVVDVLVGKAWHQFVGNLRDVDLTIAIAEVVYGHSDDLPRDFRRVVLVEL